MKMNRLDDIVKINISIASPPVDSANFDNLLLIGPPPVGATKALRAAGRYSDLQEVTDAGFAATGPDADPIGVAARIAFSQTPRLPHIFVAPILGAPMMLSGGEAAIVEIEAAGKSAPALRMSYKRHGICSEDVEVEKDGALVFGMSSFEEPDSEECFQIALCAPDGPESSLGVDEAELAGEYTVTIAATDADGNRTELCQTVKYDGEGGQESAGCETKYVPSATALSEALDAANGTAGWYVLCEAGIDQSLFAALAEWTEAKTRQFAYTFLQKEDPVAAIFFRSQGWCGLVNDCDRPGDVPEANRYLHVAAVARCLQIPAGGDNWAFKRLGAVHPAETSGTLRQKLTEGHSNFFTRHAGRSITMNGQVRGGEWIDTIRGRDWLENDMQLRIAGVLFMRDKLPFTNQGIALIENQMIAGLKAAQNRGIVAPDEYGADGSLVPGFTASVPNAQSLSAAQRASRRLYGCKFAARIAGAVNFARVDGTLTYEGGADFG